MRRKSIPSRQACSEHQTLLKKIEPAPAGRFNPARPYLVSGPTGIIQTSSSSFVGTPIEPSGNGLGSAPFGEGALNAPPEPSSESPPTSNSG